jgi:hypothetical protein
LPAFRHRFVDSNQLPGVTPLRPRPYRISSKPWTRLMTASEQMYFFGAPLAHVVLYEEVRRTSQRQRQLREAVRQRRNMSWACNVLA